MASKQNADKPQRKRTQRFNHPCPLAQRVVKKNHVWGSSCHQYLPIRLIHKSEGREHGQESPHSCVMFVGRASRRGRVYGATEDSTRPLLRKEPRPTPAYVPTIRLTLAN